MGLPSWHPRPAIRQTTGRNRRKGDLAQTQNAPPAGDGSSPLDNRRCSILLLLLLLLSVLLLLLLSMLSLLLQLLRRTGIHALRRRRHRRRRRPHHVDVHGGDRTEPRRRREPPPAPLENGARGGRARGRRTDRRKKTRGDRRRDQQVLTMFAAAASWDGAGLDFGCPAGNFSEQKVCVWGKALVVRDRGRRVGGAQGARFAGRRRAAFGIRWGFAAAGAGQTENRLQTLGSGRVKKKGRRSTSAFSLPSTCFKGRQTTSERRRGGRRNAQPDEVRGRTTDQKEKRQAAGGQALHDFTPGKPHVIVIQILCSVITITSPTIHPLRTRYTALVRTA